MNSYNENKRVYIAGMISGLTREQYTAQFRLAENLLRERGYRVCNPTSFFISRHECLYNFFGYTLTLLYDLWQLSRCDLIYKIPGWRDSRGANIESCFAYHYRIYPIPFEERSKMDKRMAKWQEKHLKVTKS